MRDGRLRRLVKWAARWNFNINLHAFRAFERWRRRTPYELGGQCRRCARCCEQPGIRVGRLVWYLPTLRWVFLWWQQHVNGFVLEERDIPSRTFLFHCTHFDRLTGACDSYASRPGICRDYPRVLLHQGAPEFFSECGHRPVAANAEALRAALENQQLTEEQRSKLEKELFLRP